MSTKATPDHEHSDDQAAHILIVDDDVVCVRTLHAVVKELGVVSFTTQATEVMGLAKQLRPSVVLLDISMPERDGYQLCSDLKSCTETQDAAIIFITSNDDLEHELKAFEVGASDFVTKPFNVQLVRARVQVQLALRREQQRLLRAQRDLAHVIRNVPGHVTFWDGGLLCQLCNDHDGRWFGVPSGGFRGKPIGEVFGDRVAESLLPLLRNLMQLAGSQGHATQSTLAMTYRASDGSRRHIHASAALRPDAQNNWGALLLITDVTEVTEAQAALGAERERAQVILRSIGDSVIATDAFGRITYVNPVAETMTEWDMADAVGQPIETIMPLLSDGEDSPLQNPIRIALRQQRKVGMALDTLLVTRNGNKVHVEDSASPIRDVEGNITGAVIVFHDVSETRAMAIKMTHLAQHDQLTDLPNRLLLADRITQAIRSAVATRNSLALMIVDLDHFKFVNDSYGHHIGDSILRVVAERLKAAFASNATVSRQGGDEFMILLPEIQSAEHARIAAQAAIDVVSAAIAIEGIDFHVGCSVGISVYPDDALTREDLMRHADSALYRSKSDGRSRYSFHSASIEHMLMQRSRTGKTLRAAIDSGRVEVHYQPQIDVPSQRVDTVEALVRLRDEAGNLIPPSEFIAYAEETGLIIPLSRAVLADACKQITAARLLGYKLHVAINVSIVQFAQPDYFESLCEQCRIHGVEPECIELEITEGLLMRDADNLRHLLERLRKRGFRVSLDDFGTGYSSLAYLSQLPIDVLKIDRSFVSNLTTSSQSVSIATAIIQLGRSLHMGLIAEGVETQEQSDMLLAMGCHTMQGYLYSKPIPGDALAAWMRGRIDAASEQIRNVSGPMQS
ncbi:EAL domain-containing protein [Acidovorax sp. A1169]|uniref:two-component system response regulator n=1 Tax=Acidovorax sp. A1169 TaxID=3059524 RepID=UPI002737BBDD|nr:EAL domain-containing protein [Acidovorax sp. A1169]MDP4075101.1 EAL domain-containing protein [Acidovorax sp. A1169]